ncbi:MULTISPECIES: cell wall metabolism sensor histidine kinase WalK [Desulfitobacterium]|uniref:histidine kinase n=1 Tax=Desulfitobacterium dehalogenans (strain ATCC 51507 / DSM 9161 / JW/IU-DC1) TaxID=756499 RepID=I4A9S0_DESDJ|nr:MULTISPECIES: HAMP domain-containing sensor histidine kinase [Desulfitobacterium]AFM00705.1 signal transduction histidine kinase [Desulfitobacterium dehalogenans ATCC 51507]
MNLKGRLISANALTVILPVVITVITAMAYIFVAGKLSDTEQVFRNTQEVARLTMELVGSENSVLRQYPEKIEDISFQKELQARMEILNGEVVVLQGENVLFSSRNLTAIDVVKLKKATVQFRGAQVDFGNQSYTVQMFDVSRGETGEGNKTTLYLLVPINPASFNTTNFLFFSGLVFLLSFIGANAISSYYFSLRILSPLHNLQKAAMEITLGNLDSEIVEEGDQEVRELCRDLERMRIQLKDSVHTQLRYEDNRKMLISSISHDLKTPVTSIKGYVEGLLDGIANSPEKKEKYLKTIYRKAEQVDTMIDDLLLYAKLDLNQIPFSFEKTNIKEFLYDGIQEIEPEMERNGIKVLFESELNTVQEIPLDRERMMRVIMNIIDNSRKYMDKTEGIITLSLRETYSSIIIEIKDNGSGIPEKDVTQIFERFYRSDTARSEIKGSGLGLAIAKQIVEGHEGRIWAVSRESKGTSVLISLPRGQ